MNNQIPGSGNQLQDTQDKIIQEERKCAPIMERALFVGDIVIIMVKYLMANPGGSKGVVYEEYDIGSGPGASIIFENGNYDGFSPVEQETMVMRVGHCEECEDYIFDNVRELSRDFNNGFFMPALTK